jgi:hypothetical protein
MIGGGAGVSVGDTEAHVTRAQSNSRDFIFCRV